MSLDNIIRSVLKEQEGSKSWYNYDEQGGYLVKCKENEGRFQISDSEFEKIKKLNDNMKELYEAHKEYLRLARLHNMGVVQRVMDKIEHKYHRR